MAYNHRYNNTNGIIGNTKKKNNFGNLALLKQSSKSFATTIGSCLKKSVLIIAGISVRKKIWNNELICTKDRWKIYSNFLMN